MMRQNHLKIQGGCFADSFLAEARAPASGQPCCWGLPQSGGSQGWAFLPGASGMAVVTWATQSGPEPCGHVGVPRLGQRLCGLTSSWEVLALAQDFPSVACLWN